MRYLCSLLGASADDLVTAETPAGYVILNDESCDPVNLILGIEGKIFDLSLI